jgi:hypothetical protein
MILSFCRRRIADTAFADKQDELRRIAEAKELAVSFIGEKCLCDQELDDPKRIRFPIVIGQTLEEIELMKRMQFNGVIFSPSFIDPQNGSYSKDYSFDRFTGRITPFSVEMIVRETHQENLNDVHSCRIKEAYAGVNSIGEGIADGLEVMQYEGKMLNHSCGPTSYDIRKQGVFRIERY